jgi:CheY-like chemotaxis protein
MTTTAPRILVVEDVESKFLDILKELSAHPAYDNHTRAENLNDAEDLLMGGGWDLVVLDLSMDIAATGSMDLGSGHATLGGLDLVERVALLKLKVPIIIVTGFDSFQDPDRFDNAIMSMTDVDEIIRSLIGGLYFGCVRYGRENWKGEFQSALDRWGDK